MDINIKVNIAMLIAIAAVEAISMLWYHNGSSWGRRMGDRYFITAIVCDVGLVFLLKFIMDNFWSVNKWEDAMLLSIWLSLLYVCYHAPHFVHNSDSFYWCFINALHKFAITFAATFCLVHFKHL